MFEGKKIIAVNENKYNENKYYVEFDEIRLIIEDGKLTGWYRP